MTDDLDPRPIKRYGNRKLYDVRASAYVSLEDLAAMVRAGETLQVTDNATGEDITAQTLTQVILDEGKRGETLLPTDLLHAALRRGRGAIGGALETGQELVGGVGATVGGAVGGAVDRLRHGVDGVLQQSIGRLTRLLPVARTDELEQLRRQLADMERTLGRLLDGQGSGAAPAAESTPTAAPVTAATPPTGAPIGTPLVVSGPAAPAVDTHDTDAPDTDAPVTSTASEAPQP